jgi:hypothetical protein
MAVHRARRTKTSQHCVVPVTRDTPTDHGLVVSLSSYDTVCKPKRTFLQSTKGYYYYELRMPVEQEIGLAVRLLFCITGRSSLFVLENET